MDQVASGRACEWPTLAVAAAIYAGFGAVTWHYHALPWWLLLPLGGYLVAWHGSLQHEVIHGHPTRWASLNEALVFPSLWLWLPFRVYRRSHLAHHGCRRLCDPLEDPESYYLTGETWERAGPLARRLLLADQTLAGRMLLGPFRAVWRTARAEAGRLARRPREFAADWLPHLAGCAVVLAWVAGACDIPLHGYLLLFAYPGLALTLLRSFAEHRPSATPGRRTAIVETSPPLALLFLNNNLHAVHHEAPGLAWYRLPARWRRHRERILRGNGGYRFDGYRAIAARFGWHPKASPVHPGAGRAGEGATPASRGEDRERR